MRLLTAAAALLLLASCPTDPVDPPDPDVPPSGAWVCAQGQGPRGFVPSTKPGEVVRDAEGRARLIIETQQAGRSLRASADLVLQLAELGVQGPRAVGSAPGSRALTESPRVYTGYGTAEVARSVAELPGVLAVSEDTIKRVAPMVGAAAAKGWATDRINQRQLPLDDDRQVLGTGAGVHVYVIDTGVRCKDLQATCGEGWSVWGDDPTYDGHGHGTFVAGEIADQRYGVATGVVIHPVKVLDSSGSGSDLGVLQGQDWVVEHARANGWLARTVWNESLGGAAAPALDSSVCAAISAGVVAVVAAGNDGPLTQSCEGSPARVWEAITVGATDKQDHVADFSSQGPCTNIHAPGVCVESVGGSCWDGTSMATPMVAAVAALLKERGQGVAELFGAATWDVLSDARGAPNRLVYAPGTEDR